MPTNNRTGKKIVEWADRSSAIGTKLDTATYIGIVKNNLDPTRSGRLQIWIPDLGGNETDSTTWRTVSYASPFFGSTFNPTAPKENSYKNSGHTYGMWAVPPDLDNQVLCTFVNGDPGRGYWFACVHSQMVSHYMVPGIAAGNAVASDTADANVKKYIDTQNGTSGVPVVEFNENDDAAISENFYNNKKPVHEDQFKQLLDQGLDKDRVRGSITSSSQRESPSQVFGISTPGRLVNDPAADEFQQALDGDSLSDELFTKYTTGARKGGHQFVMDDGDQIGIDNLVRLRSAAGHQILMNDQKRVMYIANASGSVWLEFADNGQMHVFSAGGMNFRSEGDINLHSDKNINITAKEKLNITGVNEFNFESNVIKGRSIGAMTLFAAGMNIGSEGDLNLYADGVGNFQSGGVLSCVGSAIQLNSGGGKTVAAPAKLPTMIHSDASRDDPAGPWKSVPRSLDSLCSIVPSHEPWNRATGVNRLTGAPPDGFGAGGSGAQDVSIGGAPEKIITPSVCEPKGAIKTDAQGKQITDSNGNIMRESVAEADAGPKLAATQAPTKLMPKDLLNRDDLPNPPSGIGPLTQFQVKCLMSQLAFAESNFNYEQVDSTNNYLGRYQIGAYALQDLKYIKPEYVTKYTNDAVRYPDAWFGTDDLTRAEVFLTAKGTQDKALFNLFKLNYDLLIKKSNDKYGIDPNDDLCTVAGMLAVSLLLGPGGARTWRQTGGGDARATSAAAYYNRGRYAIDVLANGGNTVTGTATTRVDKSGLTPAAQAAAAANINPDDVLTFSPFVPGQNTGSGSKEKFLAMTGEFKAMVLGAARDYKAATGQKLHVNSALRTQEDQTKLYQAWRNAGGKYANESPAGPVTVNTQYGRLSKPGQRVGNHGGGTAQDSPDNQVAKMRALGLFEKYGLQWIGPSDPPHMQRPKK